MEQVLVRKNPPTVVNVVGNFGGKEKRYGFATGFFITLFIVIGVLFALFKFLVGKVERDSLTILWGAIIFVFVLAAAIAISLVLKKIVWENS